jgi:hypothetical protein
MLSFARVRALAIVAVLLAVASFVVLRALERDDELVAEPERCQQGFVPVDLTLYDEHEIKINIINASGESGLAGREGENFANRGFQVEDTRVARNPEAAEGEIAVLRYGPQTVGAAHVIQAYFLNEAKRVFQIDRENDVVDVVIGPRFQRLATETAMRLAIGMAGDPELPAGTCAAELG